MSDILLPEVQYSECDVKDLEVSASLSGSKMTVEGVKIPTGQNTLPSPRFWDSICSKFGFGPSIFHYFSHKEVFDRVALKDPNSKIRLATQTTQLGKGTKPILLGISNPDKPVLMVPVVVEILNNLDTRKVVFRDGIIVSQHNPRSLMTFDIGPDKYETRLSLETPIDGYGKPKVWLSLVKDGNAIIGYTKAFQSSINIGSDNAAAFTLQRCMEAYNNEDGFVALKQRVAASQISWASVLEVVKLAKLIWKLKNADFSAEYVLKAYGKKNDEVEVDQLRNDLLKILYVKSGDLREIYGVVQIDSISKKKMRTLPSKAKVYDLLLFSSEMASYILTPRAAKKANEFMGELVSQEYDLETSCAEFGTFEDFKIQIGGDLKKEDITEEEDEEKETEEIE